MGMFDSEVPKELTPLQQIQQAAGEVAEKTAPWMKKTLNYESPKREMRRVASETDLSDVESIQKTFNFLMEKNPKAAVAWRKSVMPIVTANVEQQKLRTPKVSVDPVKQAKQERLNFLKTTLGDKQGNQAFLLEEQRKKIQQQKAAAGDTAYSKEAGKLAVEKDINLVTGAKTALSGLNKTQEVLDILDTGNVSTGILSDVELLGNRLISKFGGNKEALEKATNTQVLEAFLGSDVFPMIKQLGIGARGLDTPAEREFLIKVMTGDKSNELETIRRLTEFRQQLNRDIIDKYNKKLAGGGLDRYQIEFNETLAPIEFTKPRPAGTKRLVNQNTGQVIYQYPDGKFYTAEGKFYK